MDVIEETFSKEQIKDFEKEIANRKKEAEEINEKMQELVSPEPSYPATLHLNKKGEKIGLTGKVYRVLGCQ